MPIYAPTDAEDFEIHGSRFRSYVRSSRGASTLCAWRLDVPAGQPGVAHRPNHEEVVLVLEGELEIAVDDDRRVVGPGGVVHVPAGCELSVIGGPVPSAAWVTTTAGLTATIGDETISPPWAQ